MFQSESGIINDKMVSGTNYLADAIGVLAAHKGRSNSAAQRIAKNLSKVLKKSIECFQQAENISEAYMVKVQENTETLIQEIGKLEMSQRNLQMQNDVLAKRKENEENKEKELENIVNEQEKIAAEKRRIYWKADEKAKSKEKERNITTGVGIGLFAIPVVGWIAGAVTVAVSETELKKNAEAAREAADGAKNLLDRTKNDIEDTKNKLEKSRAEIKKNNEEIKRIQNEKSKLEQMIRNTKQAQSDVHTLLTKIQSLVTVVKSLFSGTYNAHQASIR